jgi:2-keto-4-pentenoate hydratase
LSRASCAGWKKVRLRQERLDAGHKPIGWKVGFGAPAALERLRLDAPLSVPDR